MNILPQNAPRQLEHVHSVEEGSTDTAEDERLHDEDERRFDNTDVGPLLSHVSLYHTKLLSRTYLYDFVCDVTRFTHLVTSHLSDLRCPRLRVFVFGQLFRNGSVIVKLCTGIFRP